MRTTTTYLLNTITGEYPGEIVKVVDTSPAQFWSWDGKAWVDTGLRA